MLVDTGIITRAHPALGAGTTNPGRSPASASMRARRWRRSADRTLGQEVEGASGRAARLGGFEGAGSTFELGELSRAEAVHDGGRCRLELLGCASKGLLIGNGCKPRRLVRQRIAQHRAHQTAGAEQVAPALLLNLP